MNDKIKIYKKQGTKGEDNHKTFSIRIKEEIVDSLDVLATETNRSRNELIAFILDYAVKNVEIIESDSSQQESNPAKG